jgi:cyclopropane fatty-acyl-phospholipid synthase-like methyltransferase
MGRIATAQLADLVQITPGDEVLDAGSGIGGTARYIAERSRCHAAAVDLTGEHCATARWLNQLPGLTTASPCAKQTSRTCRSRTRPSP